MRKMPSLVVLCLLTGAIALTGCGKRELSVLKEKGYPFDKSGFIQALRDENSEAALLFLTGGIDPATVDDRGRGAVAYAGMMNGIELLEELKKRGVSLDLPDRDGQTPLMAALLTKSNDAARWLVRNGAAVNPKTPGGLSPLMIACNVGKKEDSLIVDFLVEKGADVNARDSFGRTPLMYAVGKVRYRSTEILVVNGADVNARDNEGRHVLFYLTGDGERAERDRIVAYLKSKGAKEELSDTEK